MLTDWGLGAADMWVVRGVLIDVCEGGSGQIVQREGERHNARGERGEREDREIMKQFTTATMVAGARASDRTSHLGACSGACVH